MSERPLPLRPVADCGWDMVAPGDASMASLAEVITLAAGGDARSIR